MGWGGTPLAAGVWGTAAGGGSVSDLPVPFVAAEPGGLGCGEVGDLVGGGPGEDRGPGHECARPTGFLLCEPVRCFAGSDVGNGFFWDAFLASSRPYGAPDPRNGPVLGSGAASERPRHGLTIDQTPGLERCSPGRVRVVQRRVLRGTATMTTDAITQDKQPRAHEAPHDANSRTR